MPHLSIVIPAYNEEKRIGNTLRHIFDFLKRTGLDAEILVVDDGSTDSTVKIVTALEKDIPNLMLISQIKNMGKGAAVARGMLAGTGKYILFMDADSSTPIEEFKKLEPFLVDNHIVIGSRQGDPNLIKKTAPIYRKIITVVGRQFLKHFVIDGVRDTQCGFKLFRKDAARALAEKLVTNGFAFDIELLLRAKMMGFSIREVPVTWNHVDESRFRPVRDTIRTAIEILRIRLYLRLHS